MALTMGAFLPARAGGDGASLAHSGVPPALPGWQEQFDNSGSLERKLPLVSRQSFNEREFSYVTDSRTLNHTEWECKYHVVFIPKYRRKVIYEQIRSELKDVFRRLALQKESEIEAGHLAPDHVHLMIAIPPKYSVSQVVGFIKGKSAIHIARTYGERKRNFRGQHFWARGYFVSTVGRDEERVRNYIQAHEVGDQRQDQLNLG
jgi:putative transposase